MTLSDDLLNLYLCGWKFVFRSICQNPVGLLNSILHGGALERIRHVLFANNSHSEMSYFIVILDHKFSAILLVSQFGAFTGSLCKQMVKCFLLLC